MTQLPVLLLAELGVRDTRLLAMVYSAALFALPAALYHLALARVRHDAVLLGIVIAVIAAVYLPTSLLHHRRIQRDLRRRDRRHGGGADDGAQSRLGDAVLLCVLGLLCVRSYEAMVYLGPLLAAAIVWSARRDRRPATRALAGIAALAFVAAAVVAAATIVDYWNHPHFIKVRSMSFRLLAEPAVRHPAGRARDLRGGRAGAGRRGCRGAGRSSSWASPPPCSRSTPWWRLLHEHSILYPPAHYLARQAAGVLLAGAARLHVGSTSPGSEGRRRSSPCCACRRSSRRLVAAMTALVVAAAVPDVVLTGLWSDYLGRLRNLVDDRAGHRSGERRCRCSIGRTSCSPRTGRCPP